MFLLLEAMCLALVLDSEATGEPTLGKLAVIEVVQNRVKSPEFPNSVCEVVQESDQFAWHGFKQVSAESLGLALASELLPSVSGDLMWFHSGKKPYWASSPAVVIGKHKFYSEVK
jgi:N-acetylmuramoyl-L-alanine amidase